MERRQIAVLVTILVVLVGAIVLASRFSGAGSSSITGSKTFLAKSGTMRDKAIMLTSKKKPPPPPPRSEEPKPSDDADKVKYAASLTPTEPVPGSPEEQVAQEALNALRPEEGIAEYRGDDPFLRLHTNHYITDEFAPHETFGSVGSPGRQSAPTGREGPLGRPHSRVKHEGGDA